MLTVTIMSYDTWMSETKRGILTPRSTELKAIDTALQNYTNGRNRVKLQALRRALDAWIAAKGAGWRISARNRNGTVETLNTQVNAALGPGVSATTASALLRQVDELTAPAPTRLPGTSLSTDALVRTYCQAVKDSVHTPWITLTPAGRATAMHRALADLFPLMNGMPAPGLNLVADLGRNVGQFAFTTWNLTVASGAFSGAAQPTRAEFIDAAKTIYHEGRHCEQWFHMARYAASGGQLSAAELANGLGIPRRIADAAWSKKMDSRDAMFRFTKMWFDSVYGRSGFTREITLTALKLQRVGDPGLLANMRSANHQRYASGLPEEADAWGTEALLDAVYVWP
jgi:hypothetical protein